MDQAILRWKRKLVRRSYKTDDYGIYLLTIIRVYISPIYTGIHLYTLVYSRSLYISHGEFSMVRSLDMIIWVIYVCAWIHSHTHTPIHTHSCEHTLTHTLYILVYSHSCTHTHTYTLVNTCTHILAHAHTVYAFLLLRTHWYTHTYWCTHSSAHTHILARTHPVTHARAHTYK